VRNYINMSNKIMYSKKLLLLLWTVVDRYQGYISAALVLGGVDSTGPHLYSVHPHGSTDSLPYVTMGISVVIVCCH